MTNSTPTQLRFSPSHRFTNEALYQRHRVVAEGVEKPGQLAFLKERNCEEGQGYIFSRPVAGEQFTKLLATGIAGAIGH